MRVTIERSRVFGTLEAPPSKSMAHRLLICAGLAEGRSVIDRVDPSQDVLATARALEALGARVRLEEGRAVVDGCGGRLTAPDGPVDCGESGSTLRFFIPLLASCGRPVRLLGHGCLMQRPQDVYARLFERQGLPFSQTQQELTLCGPCLLYTSGLAEAVKAGLIADEDLFELFETGDADKDLEEILYRSLVVKKNVVENDERETGLRAVLNFGHTIGHGIESAEHLGGLYHGECVALGMLPMIEDEALRSRVKAVYKRLGLPASIEYDGDEIFRFATHDKKASGDAVTVVRVPELGQVRLDKIPLEELRTLIGEGIQ